MTKLLEDIPVDLDIESLMRSVRIDPSSDDAAVFGLMVDKTREIARPKAVYCEAFIDDRGEDTVRVGGVTFTSPMLVTNLAEVERVFAYVATCGHEMDQVDLPADDPLAEYWWDMIKAAVLGCAIKHLNARLKTAFHLGRTVHMNPGSGDAEVWPIQQQRQLFALLGDVRDLIGVELTDSCLMIPNKSVSGIQFTAEKDFRSCQVCHRESCPSRSAPFDEKLWSEIER